MNLNEKIVNKYSSLIKNSKNTKVKTNRKNSINNISGRYLFLEGKILIKEAIKAAKLRECIEIDKIFYTCDELIANEYLENQNPIKIDENILNLWSDVKTSQGIIGNLIYFKYRFQFFFVKIYFLAIGRFHEEKLFSKNEDSLAFSVLLDNVRDPGSFKVIF
jgi:hypothetical protein